MSRAEGDRLRSCIRPIWPTVRWLEEYCDTRLADVLVWRLFYPLGVKHHLFHEETDQAVVQQAREVEIAAALDYLENQLSDDGFVFGALSIADISIASLFRTASFVRYVIDPARWSRCAALVAQAQALPAFRKLACFKDCMRFRAIIFSRTSPPRITSSTSDSIPAMIAAATAAAGSRRNPARGRHDWSSSSASRSPPGDGRYVHALQLAPQHFAKMDQAGLHRHASRLERLPISACLPLRLMIETTCSSMPARSPARGPATQRCAAVSSTIRVYSRMPSMRVHGDGCP